MKTIFAEKRAFLQQFWRQNRTTGAIWPSGRPLARALSRYVREPHQTGAPRRVLEVGPGTGSVTEVALQGLRPGDQLDLVELNDGFVAHLQHRFENEPLFRAAAPQSRILHCRVQDLPDEKMYDIIICGLPFNNFEVCEVTEILGTLRRLIKPGGALSLFEYIAIRKARALVGGPATRTRLRGISQVFHELLVDEFRRERVLWNIAPAWVHHVRLG